MTALSYLPIPSDQVQAYRAGAADANGQTPERCTSDGTGVPCRHCLKEVAAGDDYLVLAHRPFPAAQPYAELGPIFLHAADCPTFEDTATPPPILRRSPRFLVRGYGADDRIVYGTGDVIERDGVSAYASDLLDRAEIAYVHVRSAQNNCYQCRIERQ